MKTYADLTDKQLIQLHCLAWNIAHPTQAVVSRYLADINVWQVRDGERRMTEFNGTTGEVLRLPANGVWNLWVITATCKKWGVDYSEGLLLHSETGEATQVCPGNPVSVLAQTFYVQLRQVLGINCQGVEIQQEPGRMLCFRIIYQVAEADYLKDAFLRIYELAYGLSELVSDESVSIDIAFIPISEPNLATS